MRHFMKLLNSATSNPRNRKEIRLVSASEVPEEINYLLRDLPELNNKQQANQHTAAVNKAVLH